MVYRATEKRVKDGRFEKGERCLLAARSLAEAARACTYEWFDLVAIGRGMIPDLYRKDSEPEGRLRVSGMFRRTNGRLARVL